MASSNGAPRMRSLPCVLVTQNDESPADSTNSAEGGGGAGGGAASRQAERTSAAVRTTRWRGAGNNEGMGVEYTAASLRADGAKGATSPSRDALHFIILIPG